ncbi:hypothetical protein [Parasitella parasitica]|uniref:Uncharacterized protein n=1 Tax=Parasitella parasitica TaxID=35722 RepID=A0A0B7N959_9FUNG|nr:hypothetical protein [Parasitella parasitica]
MDMLFHVSTWAVVSIVIEVAAKWMTPTSPSLANEETDILLPNTIQTTKWRYSSTPNALLFDFSDLDIRKEQFLSMIQSSLPSNVTASIRPVDEALAEIAIDEPEELISLHKQVRSILKNKGLHLKDRNIWLKPTTTLSLDPNLVFWQIRISEYPKVMGNDSYKQKIADTISNSFQKRDKSKLGKSVLVISGENVIFSNAIADQDSKQCTVTILAEEYTITPPPFVNPIRKLIYMPFLKRYLPIEISQIE